LNINIFDILLTSSVILLLPFFRTSAFWGKNENYGWLFFILALYFFSEIKKNIYKDPDNRDKLIIISFCFTSACALYARQLLFFLPISYLLYLFINNANKKIILTSIISFSILAITLVFIATLFQWGRFTSFFEIYTVLFLFTLFGFLNQLLMYLKVLKTHNDQPVPMANVIRPLIPLIVIIIRRLTSANF